MKTKPKVLTVKKVSTSYNISVPIKHLIDFPNLEIGMCVEMGPNMETVVFSMEEEDDKTFTTYYGPCHELYYVIEGELTMYWGKDAEKLRSGTSEKFVMHPGDIGHWVPGWKYRAKNTGTVPVKFLYCITRTPPGYKYRRTPGLG
ncbi:MAG: hypothetical protein OEZ21_04200 [Candidatus Bathyarchaeota archaeon]|nr:hypothetical protein [Candidatus Bathyarchaeota archaeon]MDH5746144.1 hypothetical protein [Candidatus Bathyarchaeota archaeon]